MKDLTREIRIQVDHIIWNDHVRDKFVWVVRSKIEKTTMFLIRPQINSQIWTKIIDNIARL